MRRPGWWIASLLVAVAMFAPATARADVFGSIGLASEGKFEGKGEAQQALYAHDAVISGNGEYVAFDGYFAGRTGVWRRNLKSGEIVPVAVGEGSESSCSTVEVETVKRGKVNVKSACDAELPSISENGQFVSFTTTAPLAPNGDENTSPDVYVRNMGVGASEQSSTACKEEEASKSGSTGSSCPFTLVSAVDGSMEGLGYSSGSGLGAVAAGRSAMSADGEQVAFVTTAVSDLAGPETPAMQVAVRNLATRHTTLVSAERTSSGEMTKKPVSGEEDGFKFGAVASSSSSLPPFPFDNHPYALPPAIGASISADGTTVAWMGRNVSKQAPMLAEETSVQYTEPLWRRIADGEGAPTRRVTGGSEPESAACIASGERKLAEPGSASTSDPCQGPFTVVQTVGVWDGSSATNAVPQLSGDGYIVAFPATAQLTVQRVDFGRGNEGDANDLYVVNMKAREEGKTANEAQEALTELASGKETEIAADGPVLDDAVSLNGQEVAFTTQRVEFTLSEPAFVSQPESVARLSEVYVVDRKNKTLTRVTHGHNSASEPSERPHKEFKTGETLPKADGALSPSLSYDGSLLAFSSTASNLVFGEGNTPSEEARTGEADGGSVFSVNRTVSAPTASVSAISSPPPGPLLVPEWRLGVTALSRAEGTVQLSVLAPTAGRLSASAFGAVIVSASHTSAARHTRARRARRTKKVAVRTIASAASVDAFGESLLVLTLKLSPGFRGLAARAGGMSATAKVSFSSPGRAALTESIPVTFRRKADHANAHKSKKAHGSRRARGSQRTR